MRRYCGWCVAALVAAVAGSGCATARNVEKASPTPFGGTTMSCYDYLGGGGQNTGFACAVMWPLWLLDKPCSFAGDVVTLPYVIWKRDAASRRPQRGDDGPGDGHPGPPAGAPDAVGRPGADARRAASPAGHPEPPSPPPSY